MTTYLFIGLIIVLAAYLLRARRARSAGSADAAPAAATSRRPSLRRTKAPAAAPAPVPLPEPAAARADAPPEPSFGPRPLEPAMSWEPGETIVEPGWPLPGEIAGAWSPSPATSGTATLPQVVTEVAPAVEWAAEPTAAESLADDPVAGGWTMPAQGEAPAGPPLWIPGRDETADAGDDAAEGAQPVWIDPSPAEVAAAEAYVAGWSPTAVAGESPSAEAQADEDAIPELAWLSEDAPAEPAWLAEIETPSAGPEPAAPDAPAGITWLGAEPEGSSPEPADLPDPVVEPAVVAAPVLAVEPAPAQEPSAVEEPGAAQEPVIPAWMPEPAPVEEAAPVAVAVAEPAASLEEQSAAVAELVSRLCEGLVPFGRVPDRLGVTPRMLALMRLLAAEPRSVTDQARALGVSRPMVADLCGRLVVLGLASREPAPADRRRVLVTLTPAGRKAVAGAASGPSPADVAERIGDLSPAEIDALVGGLRALSSRAS